MKLLLDNIADTMLSDKILFSFDDYVPDNKYDVVIVEYGNDTHDYIEMLRLAASAMALDGQAFILVPAAILFSMKHKRKREYILDNFHIKGIITLKNTVFDFSTVSLALIILDNNKGATWFTSASTMEEVIRLVSSEKYHTHNVYYSTSIDSANLMPEFYNGKSKKIDNILEKYETKTIEEIAELFVGKNVPIEELTDIEGFSYLRARNIIDGKIVASQYVKNEYVDKYAKQILFPGDILISKNFGERRIAKIQEFDCPAIASNAFIVVRALEVPEDYLYSYFCSRAGKSIFHKQLEMIEIGNTIRTINLQSFKNLRIPIFDNVTMFEMMNINKLDKQELSKLSEHIDLKVIGNKAEQIATRMFRSNGWSENDIVREDRNFFILLSTGRKYIPDIILKSNTKVLAIVEVKVSTRLTSPVWLETVEELQKYKDVPLFIFTNLNKFDVYLTRKNELVTFQTVPSKIQLLELIESGGNN
ncbi:restriction endonuclease subunit S [Peribacillus frigoritolerans]|uniref:restriction endonuclease subunit S n=1 Tax=Peribacillus frigoritolerans TaxID=450367 RepID=UPI002E204385|nr:restriction endonuclease subunit S [Peribacillus frigoritolerans]